MPTRVLDRIRGLIREGAYVVTDHAEEEMAEDDLSIADLETAILTGAILERQRDPTTRERKYVVRNRLIAFLSSADRRGRQDWPNWKARDSHCICGVTDGDQEDEVRSLWQATSRRPPGLAELREGCQAARHRYVSIVRCRDCGESYFTPETLHAVEAIKLKRAVALTLPVLVVGF